MLDSSVFNFGSHDVGVVAHDAGAANHLIAWIVNNRFESRNLRLSFHGPALTLSRELLPEFSNLPVDELIDNCSLLLLGTGWQTGIEFNALKHARLNSLHVISVLDHWTNYKMRFIRNGQKYFPNEVWVVDTYAKNIALKELSGIPITLAPNDYLKAELRKIESYPIQSSNNNRVLFLMEPIRDQWGPLSVEGEIMAFDYFIKNSCLLEKAERLEIVIRPHPSDSDDKYSSLLSFTTKVSSHASLAKQIAWADIVVGCQTYAMIIALAANKTVVSAIPKSKPRCILPHADIIHLSDLVEDHEIL